MNTSSIPFPQELTNIPIGQIFILTNPNVGISSKTIKIVEFIHSMGRKVGQKNHIVNSLPVDAPGLVDCVICKIKTEEGVQILVSDKDSLIEMLCEFWGLVYEEVCKIPDIIPGWHKTHKGVTIGGVSHPVRIPVIACNPDHTSKEDDRITLQYLTDHTREKTLDGVKRLFLDNFNFNLGISLDEFIDTYKEAEKSVKRYRLDIQVKWKEVKEYKHPKFVIHKKMTDCDLSLIDNMGNVYPFELETMAKAIYLTYLFFEDGIAYTQITYSDEFYNINKQIYRKLPRVKSDPRKFNLEDKADLDTFTNYISRIRKAILNATNDTYAVEQFAVEGWRKDNYGIAGATDENRDMVRKEFRIK